MEEVRVFIVQGKAAAVVFGKKMAWGMIKLKFSDRMVPAGLKRLYFLLTCNKKCTKFCEDLEGFFYTTFFALKLTGIS